MRGVATLLSAALLAACTPSVEETTPAEAQQLVDAMLFVRHANGLCFGAVTTSRLSLRADVAQNVSIVSVDCAKVQP